MPYLKSRFFIHSIVAFIGVPLLFWALSGPPVRSPLKASLSIVTLVAFFLMMGLFYWSRAGKAVVGDLKMARVVRLHKWVGYTVVDTLLLHPFFLVVPRFFEAGVAPLDALVTILTTTNRGVILGILAWSLMLTIGLTALVRKRLPIKYTTWRTLHGLLAAFFIVIAAWHVIDLGRHASLAMAILIVCMTAGGVQLWLGNYLSGFTVAVIQKERKQN